MYRSSIGASRYAQTTSHPFHSHGDVSGAGARHCRGHSLAADQEVHGVQDILAVEIAGLCHRLRRLRVASACESAVSVQQVGRISLSGGAGYEWVTGNSLWHTPIHRMKVSEPPHHHTPIPFDAIRTVSERFVTAVSSRHPDAQQACAVRACVITYHQKLPAAPPNAQPPRSLDNHRVRL